MPEQKPGLGAAFLCDMQGRIRSVIRDDLSLGSQLIPGRLFTSRIVRSQLQEALDFMLAVKEGAAVFGRRLTMEADGRRVPLMVNGARLEDGVLILAVPASPGSVTRSEDQVLDEFTRLNNELMNMQRSLSKQNVELNRLNDLKNQFLGMAAHDLRGSLWGISLSCKVLLQEASDDLEPELQDYLRTMSATAESLQKIVSDYLDISTIESGKLTLQIQPTALKPLLERSIQLNRVLADTKNIKVELICEAPLPELMLDSEKMLQVANNLLGNAVKYSPPGTLVTVRVPPPSSQDVVFSVEDQGKGIEAGDLQNIFEPFGRARESGRRKEKGSGLGLAIANKIVEAHGGKISVQSRPGQGSVFSVSLTVESRMPSGSTEANG